MKKGIEFCGMCHKATDALVVWTRASVFSTGLCPKCDVKLSTKVGHMQHN